ncbi:MAG: N-acetylated-alpha-linked acidic dipeptidase [Blastocatellia bacterium]|jgi:N-acetylated-alpha-linked acidic dipeptidase|nr:N-acetylated-alpha-linked acidic dipeptidase [Blastocatellia bacterium]
MNQVIRGDDKLKRTCRHAFALWLIVASIFAQSNVFSQERTSSAAVLDGFGAEESVAERRLEEQYRAVPQTDSARSHLQRLTREPHVAGTREDYETAIYVRDRMRAYGLAAELKEYQVLLPYPKQPSIVELIAPRRERLRVQEAVVAQDPTSANRKIIPLFNGYSASGDVTAPLVYVNYGLPNDYEALAKAGVEVRGRIVIARYGNSFRGVKAKVAEQHGAVGLIIYSDPADDGYAQGDVYPVGPWRPETSAQRGSVEYLFEYPGDPLTPGQPSIPGTTRIRQQDAVNIPHIPVQPISYGDARRLLEPLRGPLRPKEFQGGLPFAYHVGGTTDVRVHLKTEMDYATRTIWNVVARIEGTTEPERWVVMGNHRDAWVFGAVDPNSGTTAMLEAARGFGQLLKSGWKPQRTIVLCSWDGEEYGLIGSTEWAEELAAELKEKAVAYLNMDVGVAGANFGASSVPSLWQLIRGATRDVRDPKTGKTIYEAWQARSRSQSPLPALTSRSGTDTPIAEARIGALGSGSDYTPFLQHLGVPSLDMGFNGDYGVYHSAYDSFYWMTKFGDPTFEYHVAAAQLWGSIALRLANSEGLPLNYTDYATQLGDFLADIERTAASRNLTGAFDSKALRQALDDFGDEAEKIESRKQSLIEEAGKTRAQGNEAYTRAVARLRRINDALIAAERALTDERGLRGRAWYKHQIYAPGYYTGYAAQPLPDLRQAIEDNRSTDARDAAQRIVEAVKRATEVLKRGRD